ncbi:MAG: peptidylprolyl isomerase [Kiritimatiellia bacterium]|jgi:peptidyl-prolyl cis-trans isomerase C
MKIEFSSRLIGSVIAGVLCLGGIVSAADAAKKVEAAEKPASAAPAAVAMPMVMPAPAAVVAASNAPATVLVQVNDKTITQGDVDAEIGEISKMMQSRGRSGDQFAMMLPTIKPQIVDSLVVRALLADEFAKKNITVGDDEINKEIEKIKTTLPKGKNLEELLKSNGVSDKSFRADIMEQLKLSKLLGIGEPTDKDLKDFYDKNKSRLYEMPETVRARHILIAVNATDDAAKKAVKKEKAEALRKQLIDSKGANFEKLAQDNSDCPSKAMGGDLGEFRKGQMVPAFEVVAFGLKTNEISAVVETDFGYHVIQMTEHNLPRTVAFDEVKSQITAQYKGRQLQEKAGPFIQELRDKAKISYQNGAEPVKPMMMPPMGGAPDEESGVTTKPADKKADKEGVQTPPAEKAPAKDAGSATNKAVDKATDKTADKAPAKEEPKK